MKFHILVSFLFASGVLAQEAGSVIPFQGQLANQAGQPLSPPSPSALVFRLYRQAVGGIAIWEESQPNISVNAGRFSVLLGSRTELPAASNFNATLYLGITVDDGNPATADVEMRPRQALVPVLSAHYARNADKLNGYDWSSILAGGGDNPTKSSLAENKLPPGVATPVGGVIMWWGDVTNVPPNFEICDGTFPTTLGATLGSAKPDLRDQFVKGAAKAITSRSALGTGGTNTLNLSHQHEGRQHVHTMNHNHDAGGLWVPINSGYSAAFWFGSNPEGENRPAGNIGGSAYGWVIGPTRGTTPAEKAIVKSGTGVIGVTGDANPPTTGPTAAPTDVQLSATTDNRPAFSELFFIIRVK